MSLNFCSLSSGSSGNSYLVFSDYAAILVDAGTTRKTMLAGLEKCGISPEKIQAVFLTHEHHDHIRGLPVILRALEDSVSVYGSPGTLAATEARLSGKVDLSQGIPIDGTGALTNISIQDIRVTSFRLSHDSAEPMGFRFDVGNKSLAIVTDTGYITDSILRNILDVDLLVLEANHEENMLLMGPYPYELKKRILGERGHLSNEAAAISLTEILNNRKASEKTEPLYILLAHLSKENNLPQVAEVTIENLLFEGDHIRDKDYFMTCLQRDVSGDLICL